MVMPSGLTTRYKCDETSGTTLNDSVGTKHGTLTGGTIEFKYDTSVKRQVLSKDVERNTIYVNIPVIFSNNEFSFGFWYKHRTQSSDHGLIFYIRNSSRGDEARSFYVKASSVGFQRNTSPFPNWYFEPSTTNNDVWKHYAFTIQRTSSTSGVYRIYVNGKKEYEQTDSTYWVEDDGYNQSALISQIYQSVYHYHGSGQYFEMCFFNNKVLSDFEVINLYDETNPFKFKKYSIFDSCVAYYDFKKDAKDAIGLNNGTVTGATLTTNHLGQNNGAYSFNGSSDVITISDIGIANKTFTLFAWLANTASGFDASSYYLGSGTTTTNEALQLGWNTLNGKFTFDFFKNGLNSTTNMSTNGSWEFWVCTFNHSTKDRRIYRNGFLDANDTASANFQGTGNFFIGRGNNSSYYFKGKIGLNGVIVDKALSADEVLQLYNLTKNKVVYPIVRGGRK